MVMKIAEYKNCTIDTNHIDGESKVFFDKTIKNTNDIKYIINLCYGFNSKNDIIKLIDRIMTSFLAAEINETIEKGIEEGKVELLKKEEDNEC